VISCQISTYEWSSCWGSLRNVGGVTYLTIYSFVDTNTFFLIIAATALVVFAVVQFLEEPAGHMVEVAEDGSVVRVEMG
jgi:NNP family nitrate/nitrite transporter-like MFS transporter